MNNFAIKLGSAVLFFSAGMSFKTALMHHDYFPLILTLLAIGTGVKFGLDELTIDKTKCKEDP